jgi:predicted CoA-binding protein
MAFAQRWRTAPVTTPERDILNRYRTIAVVGASNDTDKPANYVPEYVKAHGYRIIPVNPTETEVLGERSYPDLASVPDPIEVVNIFRRSEDVPPVVDAAIEAGAKAIWMQSGIINEEAAEVARAAGLEVVMDRCMRTELRRMVEDGEWRDVER